MKTFRALAAVLTAMAFAAPAMADRLNPPRDRIAGSDARDANNSFFLEAGGPGLLYSVNYERVLENDFGLRVGFSYTSFSASAGSASASASFMAIPVIASYLGLREGNHILELGGGATAVYFNGAGSSGVVAGSGSGLTALGTAMIGYRRQPVNGGFQFRVGLEALVGKGLSFSNPDPNSFGVLPWMYMSLGFSL
jgi:hypothetical protein